MPKPSAQPILTIRSTFLILEPGEEELRLIANAWTEFNGSISDSKAAALASAMDASEKENR